MDADRPSAPLHDPAERPPRRALDRSPAAVLGAGAWGTVLAMLLAAGGREARLWARRPEHAEAMARERENRDRLPGARLPGGVAPTSDLAAALEGASVALLAVPGRSLRATLEAMPGLPAGAGLVSCAKGLEPGRLGRFSQAIAERFPDAPVAVLSGPNLAREIAAGLPAAATIASRDPAFAARVQRRLGGPSFRLYTSDDPTGVEVAGALKNVIALASGMVDALGLGENARATIIARGLAEIARLGTRLGGRPETFYGLAGVGDLVATCASESSRNHQAGARIALGERVEELEAEGLTAEGIPTVRAVHGWALEHGLDLPIAAEVFRVVFERKDPRAAIADLMTRETKPERT